MSTGDILFIVVIIAIVAALIIWIVTISARAKRMSTASDAFLAAQLEELAANPPAATIGLQAYGERSERVATAAGNGASPRTGASSTKETRLTELAELHSKALISDDELATARAKILAE